MVPFSDYFVADLSLVKGLHNISMRILERPRMALKWITPDPQREIEDAGRVCWQSWGRCDGTVECAEAFIRRLKKVGHMDVLEEAELSVWIECSRTASHQIVRHRTQHHLQASQRYIKYSEPEFMIPPSINQLQETREIFVLETIRAWDTYNKLSSLGIRKEDARFILPNAALTKLKAKGNFSNWRKFIELRSDSSAQWEIQMLSNAILEIGFKFAPAVFEDLHGKYITNAKEVNVADIVNKKEFSFNDLTASSD